ncbi:MAG: hypothetical protein HC889_15795 [Synechococcaceae cyanobacterium SM1_2_3]|nr:hypothetical protein [Synechococcaceae cyanobacterium SM1_2_3]
MPNVQLLKFLLALPLLLGLGLNGSLAKPADPAPGRHHQNTGAHHETGFAGSDDCGTAVPASLPAEQAG